MWFLNRFNCQKNSKAIEYLNHLISSFTAILKERRGDGILYYNKSKAVDSPFIATLSADRQWVVASFTRQTGNVWSNPELTCQHVDPQRPLAPGSEVTMEVKQLVIRGSVEQAFKAAMSQRDGLK